MHSGLNTFACYGTGGDVGALVRKGDKLLERISVVVPREDSNDQQPCDKAFAQVVATDLANALTSSPKIVAALKAGADPTATDAAATTVSAPAVIAPREGAAKSGAPQPTAYALVVGIEKYRDLPVPAGARADAESFAATLEKTMGVPHANVRLAIDDHATHTDLVRQLDWLKANVPANGRVYFFFSGHGAPDAAAGTPYLMPYDGDAQTVTGTGIPLAEVIHALGETKAKETLAFVDACYSGAGGRSVLPTGARPLVHVQETKSTGNVALFASSSGAEISGPSQDGKQGVFTKYLVEAIGAGKGDGDGDGQLTLRELVDYVTPRVTREAQAQSRAQTPALVQAAGAADAKTIPIVWGIK